MSDPNRWEGAPTALSDLLAKLEGTSPPNGTFEPPKCIDCGASPVWRVGATCETCRMALALADRRAALVAAWDTVPETLRWAKFDDVRLDRWARDSDAVKIARGRVGRPLVTLQGPMRAGKTTIAVAMLAETFRAASAPDASAGAIWLARRSLFVRAEALLKARDQYPLGEGDPPLVARATHAGVLLLDELVPHPDPHRVLRELINDRHVRKRPTLVTTWLTKEQCAENFGGVAGRLFEDGDLVPVRKLAAAGGGREAAQ